MLRLASDGSLDYIGVHARVVPNRLVQREGASRRDRPSRPTDGRSPTLPTPGRGADLAVVGLTTFWRLMSRCDIGIRRAGSRAIPPVGRERGLYAMKRITCS